jgi:hypothetical protein
MRSHQLTRRSELVHRHVEDLLGYAEAVQG